MKDSISITGKLIIEHYDKNGTLLKELKVPNLIMTLGKTLIAARVSGNSNMITHIGVGSGTTLPAVNQTALVAEMARSPLIVASIASANTVSYSAQFDPGVATGAIYEAALFDSLVGGVMAARTTFAILTKAPSDIVNVTWVITFN